MGGRSNRVPDWNTFAYGLKAAVALAKTPAFAPDQKLKLREEFWREFQVPAGSTRTRVRAYAATILEHSLLDLPEASPTGLPTGSVIVQFVSKEGKLAAL